MINASGSERVFYNIKHIILELDNKPYHQSHLSPVCSKTCYEV